MAPPVSHLLDAQGHYLKSTEAAGHGDGVASGRIRNRFDLDHPQVWRAIHEGRARLRTADGLYLLKSVHTLISAPVAAGTPMTSEADDQPWHLVRFIPESSLLATSLPHSPIGKFGLLGYAILIVLLGGMLAMARLRRIESASLQGAQAALRRRSWPRPPAFWSWMSTASSRWPTARRPACLDILGTNWWARRSNG